MWIYLILSLNLLLSIVNLAVLVLCVSVFVKVLPSKEIENQNPENINSGLIDPEAIRRAK